MVDAQTVLSWRPEELSTASSRLNSMSDSLLQHANALEAMRGRLMGGWQGVAARAADVALAKDEAHVRDVVRAMDVARTALGAGARSLAAARLEVRHVTQAAEADGFTVDLDSGQVSPPQTLVAESTAAAITARAQGYADDIQASVNRAAAADETLARALDGVQIPEGMGSLTQVAWAEHQAGASVWDIVGDQGTAGRNVLGGKFVWGVKGSGEQVWNLQAFIRSAVARPSLTKDIEDLLARKPYVEGGRTVTKLRLALAAAEKAYADGVSQFRTGQKVSEFGLLTKPLVRGFNEVNQAKILNGLKVAGKVSLGVNTLFAAKDMVTGGGYSGARGVTTRILGGAGLAGGVALLTGTGIGAPVAAAAVTAYGLWSLGNFAYDHRREIKDFGQRAWAGTKSAGQWVGDKARTNVAIGLAVVHKFAPNVPLPWRPW